MLLVFLHRPKMKINQEKHSIVSKIDLVIYSNICMFSRFKTCCLPDPKQRDVGTSWRNNHLWWGGSPIGFQCEEFLMYHKSIECDLRLSLTEGQILPQVLCCCEMLYKLWWMKNNIEVNMPMGLWVSIVLHFTYLL